MKTQSDIKVEWAKCPSVYRTNKWFYTAKIGETRYWVVEGHCWTVEDSHGAKWGKFRTAKEAMQAVENL